MLKSNNKKVIKNIKEFVNAVVLGTYKESKTYQEKRDELRQEAQEWQNAGAPISWLELAQKQEYFYNNAKKYGLIKEFKNEGIL